MTAIFISDLHLQAELPHITQGFLDFLTKQVGPDDSLYILGDFFEVWLGDDDKSAFNQTIIDALAARDNQIYLMHGNRDFLIGEEFAKSVGATILPDPSIIDIGHEKILLMHGDSLCTRDTEYMKARLLLRDPAFQKDFLSKSLEERRIFATSVREQSKEHNRDTESEIMDVTPEEVVSVMQSHGIRTLIHGHTHRPAIHDLIIDGAGAKRYVLGDWDKLGWCIKLDGNDLKLESFAI